MAHQTGLSCRPCLSHVRLEPQITQEFRRLLRLPLSTRVHHKEGGTRQHHVRHSAIRRSPAHLLSLYPHSSQKKPSSLHVAPHDQRTRKKTALARTTLVSKQPATPDVAAHEVCAFRWSMLPSVRQGLRSRDSCTRATSQASRPQAASGCNPCTESAKVHAGPCSSLEEVPAGTLEPELRPRVLRLPTGCSVRKPHPTC